MEAKIIYPIPKDQNSFHRYMRSIARIVFPVAAVVCLIVNLCVKGKPWSIIVIWSLYTAWKLFFSVKAVEFSLFSHFARVFIYVLVLLWLIDHFLSTGWSKTVLPIVLFGMILTLFTVFFITYDRKEKHLMSLLILGVIAIVSAPYFISFPVRNWIAFGFSAASIVLFIVLLIVSRKQVVYELKTRFIAKEREKH